MKIGILTFQGAKNYGAALQAYALQYTLNKLGCETELLRFFDRHNESIEQYGRTSKWKRVFGNAKVRNDILFHPFRYNKVRQYFHLNSDAFSAFKNNNMRLSVEPYYSVEDLKAANSLYNGFITGSDMVWTPIGQNLSAYFLQFADKGKRFSYSPSMTGCQTFSSDDSECIQSYLKEMDLISCREQEGCDYVKLTTGIDAVNTLDPTILLSKEEWCKALNITINKPSKPYILCYNFDGLPKKVKREVNRIAEKKNWNIRYIPMTSEEMAFNIRNGYTKGCGPREFVELFLNASFCVSNGYHGFLFSLISENPFVVIHREKNNAWKSNETRISDFMNRLSIADRYIEYNQNLSDSLLTLDYGPINRELQIERESSFLYLNKIKECASKNIITPTSPITNVRELPINKCTGCGLCSNVCPFDAIAMCENEEGFIVPRVDGDKCKECGKCANTCPSNIQLIKSYPLYTKLCLSKDGDVENSASGGVFITFAKHYINELKGVVYGVILDKELNCKHSEATTIDELIPMQNSKYIQSEVGECFNKVKERLKEGRKVLFSGTPCQIAALKSFLGGDHEDLLTIEVVCHGVPNQRFWKKYLHEEGKRRKIISYTFRTRANRKKEKTTLEATATYHKGHKQIPYTHSAYYGPFIRNESFRMSCYYCQYARPERIADITMSDCDSEKLYPDFYPAESKSVLLINSKKGLEIWESVKSLFEVTSLNYKQEIASNTCLGHPSIMPSARRVIYTDLQSLPWKSFVKKYTNKPSRILVVLKTVKRLLRTH